MKASGCLWPRAYNCITLLMVFSTALLPSLFVFLYDSTHNVAEINMSKMNDQKVPKGKYISITQIYI